MRLFVQIGKIADEIGEQFDLTRLVLVNTDEAQFAGPVGAHLLRAREHVPDPITEGAPPHKHAPNAQNSPNSRFSPETFTGFAGLFT